MPRDLEVSSDNKATFMDGVSQGEVSLYYSTPTNAQRIAFKSACLGQKGGQVKDTSTAAQLSFGAKILTGIEDGDFTIGGKPISSDPDSENYEPAWKKLVLTTAGDLVQSLALVAFSSIVLKYDDKDESDEENSGPDMSEIPGLDSGDIVDAAGDGAQSAEEDKKPPLE